MHELIYSLLTLILGLGCFITNYFLSKKRKKLNQTSQKKQFMKLVMIEQSLNTSWLAFCFLYPHLANLQMNKYINALYGVLMLFALALLFKSHSLYEKQVKIELKKTPFY